MTQVFIWLTAVIFVIIPFISLLTILGLVIKGKIYNSTMIREPLLVTLIIVGTILIYTYIKFNHYIKIPELYWLISSVCLYIIIWSIFTVLYFKNKSKSKVTNLPKS